MHREWCLVRRGRDAAASEHGFDRELRVEPLTTQEGDARLRAALKRMQIEPARYESPAFGPLSDSDRIALNLRHAELHLGYLKY